MGEGDDFRRLGHTMIDRLADYLAAAERREMPVLPWREPDDELAEWPADFGGGAEPGALLDKVLARSIHLHHPRFVGHQVPPPAPEAVLWNMVSSLLNNGMAVYEMGPAATMMERRVTTWLAELFNLPGTADGVLTSGGSVGNLTALFAARQAKAPHDPTAAFLVADTTHYSIKRAIHMMGLAAIPVATDADFRLLPCDLPRARAAAIARGPVIGVVASTGSTATGAYDPLPAIADFCAEHDLWLHVDGAHGAAAALSARHRGLTNGIERADSIVIDAHKLLRQPALVTAVLFRDGRTSYGAFAEEASYLYDGDDRWYDLGLRTFECTKRMMGLQLYAALAVHGAGALAEHVELLFERARRFADHLATRPDFEVVPPACNIVCFRHLAPDTTDLDAHQNRVRDRLVRDGSFYLVKTRLRDRLYLRVAIMNPATTDDDLVALAEAVATPSPPPSPPPSPAASGSD